MRMVARKAEQLYRGAFFHARNMKTSATKSMDTLIATWTVEMRTRGRENI